MAMANNNLHDCGGLWWIEHPAPRREWRRIGQRQAARMQMNDMVLWKGHIGWFILLFNRKMIENTVLRSFAGLGKHGAYHVSTWGRREVPALSRVNGSSAAWRRLKQACHGAFYTSPNLQPNLVITISAVFDLVLSSGERSGLAAAVCFQENWEWSHQTTRARRFLMLNTIGRNGETRWTQYTGSSKKFTIAFVCRRSWLRTPWARTHKICQEWKVQWISNKRSST